MVGSAFAAFVFFHRFQHTRVVDRFLCFGALLQLSALHGHNLPGLPSCRRLPEVSNIHRIYNRAGSADRVTFAFLAGHSSVDIHDLSDLESLALQRTELRPVHDVRRPCRSAPWQGRTPRSLRRLYNVLSYSFSGIPHWSFIGPFVRFAGNSSGCESLGASWNGRGFPHALSLRFVTSGAGCRVAKTAAMPDTILLPVSVVLAARGYVAYQRNGDPTKPL